MKCVAALSTARNSDAAIADVVGRVADGLEGEPADLAVVFASSHHADAMGRIARTIRDRALARHVLGCTGESIVGDGREVEKTPALSLWASRLPGVALTPRRLTFDDDGLHGWEPADPTASPRPTLLALGDPFTFPADPFLRAVNDRARGVRVVGGMASAGQSPGSNRLVLDDKVFDDGAVAVEVGGPLTVRAIVSQGCRPVGRSLIVTRAEKNVIRELGRRPALEVLQEIFEDLSDDDKERVQHGLHLGRVINEYRESFHRGDFLVRNVLGADESGGIAVTDVIRVGQTVQFHVRDAESADEDLRALLENDRLAHPASRVRGALLFTCNGRGTRLFSEENHDVGLLRRVLGPVPVAGFFAMGELGPVGDENFMHGFTASVVLFEEKGEAGS